MKLRLGIVTCQPHLATAAAYLATDKAAQPLEVDVFFNGCEPSGLYTRAFTASENLGQVRGMHEIWKAYGDRGPDDLLALIHDDLMILEHEWDDRVREVFQDPNVLLAGFAGARAIGPKGNKILRSRFFCGMIDAERHGSRAREPLRVAMLDDLAIVVRMSLLDELGGFDWWPYPYHCVDSALGLEVARRGKESWMVPIRCVHLGYQTSKTEGYDALAAKYGGKDAVLTGGHRKLCTDYADLLPLVIDE